MSTKTLLDKDKADQLARLLNAERLKKAGVATEPRRSKADPDLEALLERARSTAMTTSMKRASKISPQFVKKLAGA